MDKCTVCGKKLTWENSTLCIKCKVPLCEDCSSKNNYKCNKCSDKIKIKIPDVIRRSSIEDYKSCPFYFKLHVIDGNEPRQNVLARLGSDLHEMYEQVQRGDLEPNIEALKSSLDWYMAHIEEDYPDEDMDRLWNRAEICNKNFLSIYQTFENKAVTFEERIEFPVGKDLPKVTIAYDRLEEDENGDLHIIDWKTGEVMSGKKLTTDLQPALYLKAVEQKYGKMPKSFRLIYLSDTYKDGSHKERLFTSIDGNKFVCKVGKKEYIQDISEQLKVVQKLFSQIKARNFNIPEKPDYFKCKMCSFREDGLCSGNDTESWKLINKEREVYGW